MYGYNESVDIQSSGSNIPFGLNKQCFLSKFELFSKEEGQDKTLDVEFTIGEKVFKNRYFPIDRVWKKIGGENVEITDKTSEDYEIEANKAKKVFSASIISIVKCFVSEDKIKTALKTPISSFNQYVEILDSLIKSNPMWDAQELDVFVEYQYKPSKDQTRTFLTIPKDIKQGEFVCASQKGEFKEVRTKVSLNYVNEAGVQHPFKRNKWYLESPYSNQIDFGAKENPVTEEVYTPNW